MLKDFGKCVREPVRANPVPDSGRQEGSTIAINANSRAGSVGETGSRRCRKFAHVISYLLACAWAAQLVGCERVDSSTRLNWIGPKPATEKVSSYNVVCVLRTATSCTASNLDQTLAAALERGVEEAAPVQLYIAPSGHGLRRLGSSVPWNSPRRGGDRAIEQSRRTWVSEEKKRLLDLALPSLDQPKGYAQNLVEILGKVALEAPNKGNREIWFVSDGRNVSADTYGDQDCKKPDPKAFATATSARALPAKSLTGLRVRFAFTTTSVAPRPDEREKCVMPPQKVMAIRKAWTEAIEKANGSVDFSSGVPANDGAD